MWPQASVHSEEEYLLGLAKFFTSLPRWQVDAICNPTAGFITLHKFPPSIAEIHEWTKPRETPDLRSAPPFPGPNFTYSGDIPHPSKLSLEERKAFVIRELGYDPIKQRPAGSSFASTSRDDAAPKPWHDKDALAASRDRIAAYMESDKYLFKDRLP